MVGSDCFQLLLWYEIIYRDDDDDGDEDDVDDGDDDDVVDGDDDDGLRFNI